MTERTYAVRDSQAPRILVITRNLPPLTGGMERLVHQAILGLHTDAQVTVIGPTGCRAELPTDIDVYEVPISPGGFLAQSLLCARRLARAGAYDLVLGGSGLCALAVTHAARRAGARSAILVHGLDLVVDNLLYRHLVRPRLAQADLLIANSRNTLDIAQREGLARNATVVINPGTQLPDVAGLPDFATFCAGHDIPFSRFLLFTGRMTERKGLSAFLRHCLPDIVANSSDTGLVVVGHEPSQSLNRRGEEADVMRAVEELGLKEHVIFLGKLHDADLLAAYALAAVQVFPLREVRADVEGFGMVAVEAAACGTPTVAFDVGGVGDAISDDSGYLVAAGDYAAFTRQVLHVLDTGEPNQARCRAHATGFAWPRYHEQLEDALLSLSGGGTTTP